MAETVFAHNHTINISTGDSTINFTKRITGAAKIAKAATILDGAVNQSVALSITDEQVKSVVVSSTKEVTFKVNTAGGNPVVIGPGNPFIWKEGDQDTPFGADITALLFSNASGAEASVLIQAIQSGTPLPTPTPTPTPTGV
jgi:hypothetical protein